MNEQHSRREACRWDPDQATSHQEICCCYVETDEGTFENPCIEPMDECCC